MNDIFRIAARLIPVADSIGIGQVWRNMVTERSAKSCALASLQATGKGHADLAAFADACFDTCDYEDNIRKAFIEASNIEVRMKHREASDEA